MPRGGETGVIETERGDCSSGTVLSLPARTSALADCVDINAEPADRLTAIAHINDERAGQLIAGRP